MVKIKHLHTQGPVALSVFAQISLIMLTTRQQIVIMPINFPENENEG